MAGVGIERPVPREKASGRNVCRRWRKNEDDRDDMQRDGRTTAVSWRSGAVEGWRAT